LSIDHVLAKKSLLTPNPVKTFLLNFNFSLLTEEGGEITTAAFAIGETVAMVNLT